MKNLNNLYFLSQDLTLKRQSNQLSVYRKNEKLIAYPLSMFSSIFLFGRINIETSLINFLLDNNKFIVFLNQRGMYRGILFNKNTQSNNLKRIKQYKIYFSEKERLNLVKSLISFKIDKIEKFFNIDLKKYKTALSKAKKIETVLGIEGLVSNLMFGEFRKYLKKINIHFDTRNYYPPTDEINSLLSTFFTIFYNVLIPEVYKEGLDPFLGLLHIKRGVHHALVSDLMEIIRPDIVYLVYEFLKEFTIDDLAFGQYNRGVYLSIDSLKKVLEWIVSNHLNEKVSSVKKHIQILF